MAHVVEQTDRSGIQSALDPAPEAVATPQATKKCVTRLIPDDPAGSDAFGPHKTVAEAIADLINSKDIPTDQTSATSGKAIGIEGSWGSGKTTVIELLSGMIADKERCAVFVFDAWAHEGDPLRRTFLESLIDHFIGLGWFRESDWANDKKVIQRQLEMKSTRTIPQFTRLGIVVLLSLAMIPIGNAIVGAELREAKITLDPTLPFASRFIFGLALLTLPALIVLASWFAVKLFRWVLPLYYWFKNVPAAGIPQRSAESILDATIWGMLLNKALTEKRFETNDTPVPTSIEFENSFNKIMTSALKDKDRKVVLVLDNLDRIAPAAALSIWSTLQTFLRPRRIPGREIEWLSRLWVIMPYDSQGLFQLWTKGSTNQRNETSQPAPNGQSNRQAISNSQSENGADSQQTAPSAPNPDAQNSTPQAESSPGVQASTETDKQSQLAAAGNRQSEDGLFPAESRVALSFLDKSFQVRFEVPPPILSDWNTYLKRYLEDAFPEHEKSPADKPWAERRREFHACYRLYYWYLDKTKEHATPRGLKLYVNQIGVLHRQRQDEFPLHHLAYHVLLRRLGCDTIAELLQHRLPHNDLDNLLGPDASGNLAAIAFNTTVEKARQIILDGPINGAITIRKPERFMEESKHAGFWEALERVTEDQFDKGQIVMFANLAYCLNKSRLLAAERGEVDRIRLAMARALDMHRKIWPFDNEVAEGLAELCKILRDSQTVLFILQGIGEGLVSATKVREQPIDIGSWIAAINVILEQLRSLGFAVDNSQQPVGLRPLTEEERAEIAAAEGSTPVREPDPDVYGPALVQLLERVCERIAVRLEIEKPLPMHELTRLLEAICELHFGIAGGSTSLAGLVSHGHLARHLSAAAPTKDTDAIAWCLFADLHGSPIHTQPPRIGGSFGTEDKVSTILAGMSQEVETERVAGKFGSLLARFNTTNVLFDLVDADDRFKTFAAAAVSEISLKTSIIIPQLVLEHWTFFAESFADRLPDLIARTADASEWIARVRRESFQRYQAPLYKAIGDLRGSLQNIDFQTFIRDGLSSMTHQEWLAELSSPGSLLAILQKLVSLNVELKLGEAFTSGLIEHTALLAKGQAQTILFQERIGDWEKMVSAIGPDAGDQPRPLGAAIYEIATTTMRVIEGTFFECWGQTLAAEILQRDRSIVFEKLFERLVRTQEVKGLRWLANLFSAHPELSAGYETDSAMMSFREAIRVALYIQPAEAGAIPMLEQLGNAMNVERPDVVPIRGEAAVLPREGLVFVSSESKIVAVRNAEFNSVPLQTINVTIETQDGFKRLLNIIKDDLGAPMTFHYETEKPDLTAFT